MMHTLVQSRSGFGQKAMAQAKASQSQARARYFGLALDFTRPKPHKSGPKPWLSGQAKARTSLVAEKVLIASELRRELSGL